MNAGVLFRAQNGLQVSRKPAHTPKGVHGDGRQQDKAAIVTFRGCGFETRHPHKNWRRSFAKCGVGALMRRGAYMTGGRCKSRAGLTASISSRLA